MVNINETEQVWLAMPSANIEMACKTFPEWRKRGYKIAVICPDKLKQEYETIVDLIVLESETGGYAGWPKSVNYLSKILKNVDIIIAAGDDMYPDENHSAQELRKQFLEHFGGTLGVMQPYGDKFGSMACKECEQICGSAWLGREFRNRVNMGSGPFWEQYFHMYADTELYQVAKKHGCLWIREDLSQYHAHRLRKHHRFMPTIPGGNLNVAEKLYFQRKQQNFPNTELL
jgi:hypothetical protein